MFLLPQTNQIRSYIDVSRALINFEQCDHLPYLNIFAANTDASKSVFDLGRKIVLVGMETTKCH